MNRVIVVYVVNLHLHTPMEHFWLHGNGVVQSQSPLSRQSSSATAHIMVERYFDRLSCNQPTLKGAAKSTSRIDAVPPSCLCALRYHCRFSKEVHMHVHGLRKRCQSTFPRVFATLARDPRAFGSNRRMCVSPRHVHVDVNRWARAPKRTTLVFGGK